MGFNLFGLGKRIEEILGGVGNQAQRALGNAGNQAQQGVRQVQNTVNQVSRPVFRQVQQVQRQIPQPPRVDFNKLSQNLVNAANPINQVRQQANSVNRTIAKVNPLGVVGGVLNNAPSEVPKFITGGGVLRYTVPGLAKASDDMTKNLLSSAQKNIGMNSTQMVDRTGGVINDRLKDVPYVGDATRNVGSMLVEPIAKSGARWSDVAGGTQKYDSGLKGYAQVGTDMFNLGQLAYTPAKAGELAMGGKVALKAVPEALARGAGAGAGINAINQYSETGKIDPGQVALSAAIGAGANLLPGAGSLVKGSAKYLNSPEALTQGGFAKLPGGKVDDITTNPKVKANEPDVPANRVSEQQAKDIAFKRYQETGSRADYDKAYNEAMAINQITSRPESTSPRGLGKNDEVPLQVTNMGTLRGDIQRLMVDKDAPLLRLAKQLEKEDPIKNKGLVDDVYYYTGLQRRSNSIANERINESESLSGAFKGLNKQQASQFDEYVAARRGVIDAKEGKSTNLPVKELNAKIKELGPEYQARFEQLNGYYKEWAKYLYDAQIISDKKYKTYLKNNDYTRIQRDMEDLVNFNTPGKAMSAKVNGVTNQRRKGSTRDIMPAAETAVGYAQHAQAEIQRNESAKMLIDMLSGNGMAKKIPSSQATNKNTINLKINGKVEVWEVPKDIKEIADQVSPYTLGTLGKIIAAPQRLLRAGATGLSAPFTAANYIKDQGSSAIFSKDAKATSFNLKNIANGLFQGAKDFGYKTNDPAWEKFMLHMGDDTQYHGIRNVANVKDISRELRLGQKGKYANMGLHTIRTLEDLNSITEKATRFQHFKGIYDKVLKETGSEAEASKKATLAAWQNSTDFARMGDAGRVINLLIPYFNAGIQGTRLMGRRLHDAPVATGSKMLAFAGLPLAAVTAYNLSDPERKKVYDNISPYEKENNFIVVLPGAKQDESGTYEGVFKIPLQPGLSDAIQPIRRGVESFKNKSPLDFAAIGGDLISAVAGPIETKSLESFGGSLTPQFAKPIVQQALNRDLYTGKQIIPDYMNNATDANGNAVPEYKKAYENTSGSSRFIAEKLGVSPLRVDKFIKDTSSKVGQYSQNIIDKSLAAGGAIPKNQIGGVSITDDFIRRFGKASAVENFNKSEGAKYYDKVKEVTTNMNKNELAAYDALHPSKKNFLGERILEDDSTYDPAARLDIYNRFPKVYEADKRMDLMNREKGEPGNPLFDLTPAQLKKVLEKDNLPPGAKDPELSNLYSQDWYAEYKNNKTAFYTALKTKAEAEGRQFGSKDNPYPDTPPELQKVMDYYNNLPKGTGDRSQWIRSNPGLFDAMKGQWAAVDEWQNNARSKRGLARTEGKEGVANGFGTDSSYSKYASSGGGSKGSSNPYKYDVALGAGGKIYQPKVKVIQAGTVKAAVKSAQPKIAIKKSKV